MIIVQLPQRLKDRRREPARRYAGRTGAQGPAGARKRPR